MKRISDEGDRGVIPDRMEGEMETKQKKRETDQGLRTLPLSWRPDRGRLNRPIYRSIAQMMESDIENGYLTPGTRLPAQKELAEYLDVNTTTVTRAYSFCQEKGMVYSVPGSGTYVAGSVHFPEPEGVIKFRRDQVDLASPAYFDRFNDVVTEGVRNVVITSSLRDLLDYSCPEGIPSHKAAGISWLRNVGLRTVPDHLAIVPGAAEALSIAMLTLFRAGDRLAVDPFVPERLITLARLMGIQLVPVPSDNHGMIPGELEVINRRTPITGVYLMPSCSDPAAIYMTEERKRALAGVILRGSMILVENDPFAFFTADVNPDYQGPVARLVPNRAVYISTAAEPVSGSLKAGYMVAGDMVRGRLFRGLEAMDLRTSAVSAAVLTRLVTSGAAREIVGRKRRLAIAANNIFDSCMNKFYSPSKRNVGNPLSFYRWIPLKGRTSGTTIENDLEDLGVKVAHSSRFAADPENRDSFLKITLSGAHTDLQLELGLETVFRYIKSKGL